MVILTQPWPQWHPSQLSVPTSALALTADLLMDRECVRQRSQPSFNFKLVQLLLQSSFAQFIRTHLLYRICISPSLGGTPVAWTEELFKDLAKLVLTYQRDHMHPNQNWGEEGAFWAAESPLHHHYTMQRCAMITSWAGRRDSSAGFLIPLISLGMNSLNWHI